MTAKRRPRSKPDVLRPTRACNVLKKRDPRFAKLIRILGVPEIGQRPSTFEAIARSITYQQLSGAAAGTIWNRLLAKFPGGVLDPERVLRKRMTTLRGAGLSQAKANSIKDLARHVVDGSLDPEGLVDHPDDEVIERLVQVKGIGPWSAHMHLMFALGRPDVWPVGDLGVRKGLAKFLDLPETPTEKASIPLGEPYRPYRSTFAFLMWRILETEEWTP